MTRNAGPSSLQLEKLIGFMEVRTDLATGHARTANARTRMRSGWMEIATVLNSVGDGCIKDWKQWAKEHECPVLRPLCSETGDSESILRHLNNDVPEQSSNTDNVTILDAQNMQWEGTAAAIAGDTVAENLTPSIDTPHNIIIEDVYTLQEVEIASPPDAVRNVAVTEGIPTTGVSDGVRARRRICFDSPSRRRGSSTPAAAQGPSTAAQHRRRTALASPRAGAHPVRRRPLQRSPPSQRRSEMASLTERFIAIEERRTEAELAWARAMEANAQGPKILAEALDRFTNAVSQCVERVLCNRPQNTST
ncbi:uncharacterized protein LOC121727292 isoform X1 [Aricia agestis]|uniref:uncharacterized protein LOC121727292 isoform X1 n=1 Tax=Aricia agestis TaxID=91739 RepID=UPI001C209016|nr:uncharacterized protein LOC121727292 isoform X1 [Aricia agestis]